MTEASFPWDGNSASGGAGDCGPYAANTWDDLYRFLMTGDQHASEGILAGVGGELAVTGTSSPVAVADGAAMVNGKFYKNTASVDVAVPTPSTATRIDRIVLQADYTAQTVRIARVAGSEGGAAPAVTQSDGVTWVISLAQVSITTAGVIAVTSERVAIDQQRMPGEIVMMNVTTVDANKNPVINGITYKRWFLADGGTYNSRVTPNLADRIPIGVGTIAAAQGTTGGASTKNLAHVHAAGSIVTASDGAHTHAVGTLAVAAHSAHTHAAGTLVADAQAFSYPSGLETGDVATKVHTHTISGNTGSGGPTTHTVSGSTASGGAHTHAMSGNSASAGSATQDIMPPYIGVYWFMYSP